MWIRILYIGILNTSDVEIKRLTGRINEGISYMKENEYHLQEETAREREASLNQQNEIKQYVLFLSCLLVPVFELGYSTDQTRIEER